MLTSGEFSSHQRNPKRFVQELNKRLNPHLNFPLSRKTPSRPEASRRTSISGLQPTLFAFSASLWPSSGSASLAAADSGAGYPAETSPLPLPHPCGFPKWKEKKNKNRAISFNSQGINLSPGSRWKKYSGGVCKGNEGIFFFWSWKLVLLGCCEGCLANTASFWAGRSSYVMLKCGFGSGEEEEDGDGCTSSPWMRPSAECRGREGGARGQARTHTD